MLGSAHSVMPVPGRRQVQRAKIRRGEGQRIAVGIERRSSGEGHGSPVVRHSARGFRFRPAGHGDGRLTVDDGRGGKAAFAVGDAMNVVSLPLKSALGVSEQ
jgi:hypothetical protein